MASITKITSEVVGLAEVLLWDSADKAKAFYTQAFFLQSENKERGNAFFSEKRVFLISSALLLSLPLMGTITFSLYGALFAKAFLVRVVSACSFFILLSSLYQKVLRLEKEKRGFQNGLDKALFSFWRLEENLQAQIGLYKGALQREAESRGKSLEEVEKKERELGVLSFFGRMLYSLDEKKISLFLLRFETYLRNKKELDLSFLSLEDLPENCFQKGFEELEVLILSDNRFRIIPQAVQQLGYVKAQGEKLFLEMERNLLERLPPDFYSWALQLKGLVLDFSHLQSIPSLGEMLSLKRNLSYLKLTSFFSTEIFLSMQDSLGEDLTREEREIYYLNLFFSLKEGKELFFRCFSNLTQSFEGASQRTLSKAVVFIQALQLCLQNEEFKAIFLQSCERALEGQYFDSTLFLFQIWHDFCSFRSQFPEGKSGQEFLIGVERRLYIQKEAKKCFFKHFFCNAIFQEFVIHASQALSQEREVDLQKGISLVIARIERFLVLHLRAKFWIASLPREEFFFEGTLPDVLEFSMMDSFPHNIRIAFNLRSIEKGLAKII